MKTSYKKLGFTLIEIIISISIISVMLLISVDVIKSSNKILKKSEKYLDLTEEILLVKKQFNFDFEYLERSSYLPFQIINQAGNDIFVLSIAPVAWIYGQTVSILIIRIFLSKISSISSSVMETELL